MFNTIVSTGYILPTSVISNGQITGNPWADPNNLLLVDTDLALSNPGQGQSSDVIIGNYNFNVPANAVIVGIEMQVIAKRGQQTSPVITLTPYAVDNTSGTDIYYPYSPAYTGLTQSLATHILGGQNYLFNSSFTPNQINNMKFGLVTNGDVQVDSMLVQIYYYVPAPVVPPTPITGTCIDCESPIQVQSMTLALPFLINQTKFYLTKGSFAYPDGTPVQPGDAGSCGGKIPFVFDQGKRKSAGGNFEENAMLDTNIGSWTVLPSGIIEVDLGVVTQRGLDFKTPGTHVATLMSDHDANSEVIISNNTPYNLTLVRRCQVDTVFAPPIEIEDENIQVTPSLHKMNFLGAGVTAVATSPNDVDVIIPGVGGTTPPQVAGVGSATSGNVQVTSLTFTVPSLGINRGALVQISTEELVTVVSVDVGGSPASQLVSETDVANNLRQEQWGVIAQPVGTLTVTITLSAPAYISAGCETFVGMDQTTGFGAVQNSSGASNVPFVNLVTTTDYSLVVDGLVTAQTPILYTVGAGQTLNWSRTANSDTRQGASSLALAGLQPDSVIMDYSITQNTDWCITAVEVLGITTAFPSGPDQFVKVNNADTTSGFLDDKIELVPISPNITIVKTILNPGANEKIQYGLDSVGGSGSGNNFTTDQTPLGTGSTYNLLQGTIDGVNTTFTVDAGSYISGALNVFLNGLELQQGSGEDWVETNPLAGTFDFIVPPIPGDIITVQYQTTAGTFGAQTGIQFQDEGVNLGTPGTVNELDFIGPGVTATRAGDKVTVNIPGGGTSGGLGGGTLPIEMNTRTTGNSPYGPTFEVGNRLYVPLRNGLTSGANAVYNQTLRIFQKPANNAWYVRETEVSFNALLTVVPGSVAPYVYTYNWTSDGTYIYALVQYSAPNTVNPAFRRNLIDIVRCDLDGLNPVVTNIYDVFGSDPQPFLGQVGFIAIGTNLFMGRMFGGSMYMEEWSIVGTVYTFVARYLIDPADWATFNPNAGTTVLTYNQIDNYFYLISNGNAGGIPFLSKWEIQGTDFVLLARGQTYPGLEYENGTIINTSLGANYPFNSSTQIFISDLQVVNSQDALLRILYLEQNFTDIYSTANDFVSNKFILKDFTYPKY